MLQLPCELVCLCAVLAHALFQDTSRWKLFPIDLIPGLIIKIRAGFGHKQMHGSSQVSSISDTQHGCTGHEAAYAQF